MANFTSVQALATQFLDYAVNNSQLLLKNFDYQNLDIGFKNPAIFQLLFINHAIIVANSVYSMFTATTRKQPPFIVGFLMTIVMGFGGGIVNSLLTAQPQPFLDSDYLLLIFAAAWFVTYFSFGLWTWITGNVLVELVTYAIQGLFVAEFCFLGVDQGVKVFPNTHIAPVVIGTIATCGGSFILPFFMNLYLGEPVMSSGFSNFGLEQLIPLASAVLYYVTRKLKLLDTYTVKYDKYNVVLNPEVVIRGAFVFLFLYFWLGNRISYFTSSKPVEASKPSARTEPVTGIPTASKASPTTSLKKRK
jgi:uncharacterized membrane protein YeiH